MPTLREIQQKINDFICAAISAEYNTNWEKPVDVSSKANDLIQIIQDYSNEIMEEQNAERKD